MLAAMGRRGWELVSVDDGLAYLKRPRSLTRRPVLSSGRKRTGCTGRAARLCSRRVAPMSPFGATHSVSPPPMWVGRPGVSPDANG